MPLRQHEAPVLLTASWASILPSCPPPSTPTTAVRGSPFGVTCTASWPAAAIAITLWRRLLDVLQQGCRIPRCGPDGDLLPLGSRIGRVARLWHGWTPVRMMV